MARVTGSKGLLAARAGAYTTGYLYIDYSVSETNTQYTITTSAGVVLETNVGGAAMFSMSGSRVETEKEFGFSSGAGARIVFSSKTTTINKTKNTQNIKINENIRVIYPASQGSNAGSAVLSINVPAKPSYAIKYDANGGTGAPGGQTKWYGEDINLQPGKPTRSGYSFKNWNTKQDGTGTSYNPSQKYTANAGLTLYAQWNPNPYTVTYNANGGSGAPGPQTKYHGIDLVLTTDVPARPGYAFKGWNTKQDGSGTNFNAGGTYTVNSAVTLYAQWEAFNLIKIYDANGNVHLGKLMVYDENGVLKECSIAVYDADGNRKYAKV